MSECGRVMCVTIKGQNEDSCGDSVFWLNLVDIPVMLLYFSFLRCYHEGNLSKGHKGSL